MITLLLTQDEKMGISHEDGIPWYFDEETDYYIEKIKNTEGSKALIMSKETSFDIRFLDAHCPIYLIKDCDTCDTINDCKLRVNHIFVFGNIALLQKLIVNYKLDAILLIKIHAWYDCNSVVSLDLSPYKRINEELKDVHDHKTNQSIQVEFKHYTL